MVYQRRTGFGRSCLPQAVKVWLFVVVFQWTWQQYEALEKESRTVSTKVRGQGGVQPPERPALVLDALEKNQPLYYFGLGSNMSRKKLENRGVNGTKIEVLKMEAAVVPNYRLAFNMRGFPPLEPGMGSLEPSDSSALPALLYSSSECHGALCKLTPENYEKVMRSEGVGSGSANQGYEEIVVDAFPYSSSGGILPARPVKAVALRARPHVRLSFDPSPSVRYMSILREGARELGLKSEYQQFLADHPVQTLSQWQRLEALYNILFTFSLAQKLKWRGISRLQSRILFLVYARPRSPALLQRTSTFLSAVILFPGCVAGLLYSFVLKLSGKKLPPFWSTLASADNSSKNDASTK